MLMNILVPLAVELVKLYFRNTETKYDDRILDVVQSGCRYLADKENNTVDQIAVNILSSHEMIGGK